MFITATIIQLELMVLKSRWGILLIDACSGNVQLQLIQKAEQWVIRSVRKGLYHQVILCTCSTAGSKRVRESCNNTNQCIVDESGMCLEPETIVPIVWSQAKQVVLIGDHMQLQPIVINRVARSLGLRSSLFERYATNNDALMLEEQYRMVSMGKWVC